MIIRPSGSACILITQPDHAALAARIMGAWKADGLDRSPRRAEILLAVQEHDNGWREVDVSPLVDGGGRVLDFVIAPDDVRRGVWPRGVARLSETPYAAALVAQHAIHIYRRYRGAAAWEPFFAEMEAARDRHLQSATPQLTRDDLTRDYFFVRIGDLVSLTFCNGWTEPQSDETGYTVRLDGDQLFVTPDPFSGETIPVEITGRELSDGLYESADDARRAFRRARIVTITGTVSTEH